MKRLNSYIICTLAFAAMLVLILDTKTALYGAKEGLQLCLQTVIPSIFPFLILSGVLNRSILGQALPPLRPLGKLCKIPKGGESLLLLGLIGGYPVGAQLIAQSYSDGRLTPKAARRMLGFCSNAGPSFLFGMLSPLFSNPLTPWFLWGIHIISALLVGCILPGDIDISCEIKKAPPISAAEALQNAIRTMASISGWVVVFRIILAFCNRWFLWILPVPAQVLFSGLLELSNGCVLLKEVQTEGTRFILASVLLAAGGLCVGMQTVSVTKSTGLGSYFPGKVLQTLLAFLLSATVQQTLFPTSEAFHISAHWFTVPLLGIATLFSAAKKKSCSNPQKIIV